MEIQELYQRYGPMVMRRCRKLLRDEDEALDVTQDVFVKVLEHRFNLHDGYPSSLLYRIATNLCLNRIRDRRRHAETPADGLLNRLADSGDADARLTARSLLDRLFGLRQESTRTIAVLHYVDGLTLEETAREVGMSLSGVRKRLRGLRATLKEISK